ncbi:type 12 methyltransferase [Shewanella colwelliana]|uniref:Type 12 methyltransferase n=1 Tax=Shewanella colwelliana TaxID=23 RepID=A0ABQ4NVW2_SHECO|nr:class I SAM-dependent methyltransferase [Shewanella colwelliana]MDX1279671.1 class I SAM-dependent methyltransferase [Shewanella colwelliana]GIU26522.1 type 12 methyltransferase [Shewanella colwelliana]GIU37291.1 type 12 methyltransferase [Shewanella colwelliana]
MEKKRLKANVSALLLDHERLLHTSPTADVLDLACGSGRNGLWFAEQGAKVTFIDQDISRLPSLPQNCHARSQNLENDGQQHLPTAQFDMVLVFNYLHRPLFGQIAQAIKPGGLLIYETFTTTQATVGRPKNPDFLLTANELLNRFNQFEPLHYFEGNVGCELAPCFKAQMIAKKPRR